MAVKIGVHRKAMNGGLGLTFAAPAGKGRSCRAAQCLDFNSFGNGESIFKFDTQVS
jgi:hypothetical protein